MEELKNYLESLKIQNIDKILNKFSIYYDLLIEWNNKFNLTSITDKKDVEIKHFIDSISSYNYINNNSLICDIGAGAGFPSIPLAILKNDSHFVLVDSLNKRVNFLNEVINKLELKNCECIHARVEDFAIKNKNRFDYTIARAVAHKPEIIFADEPTAALDFSTGTAVLGLFRELVHDDGITVVMTTHDEAMMELADVVYSLEDGEIVDIKRNNIE